MAPVDFPDLPGLADELSDSADLRDKYARAPRVDLAASSMIAPFHQGPGRGLSSFTPTLHVDVPRITKELRLPAFKYPGERYVWPRRHDHSI